MTGDELRRERGRLHLTQRQLASRVGVGLRTITNWEALGSHALPRTAEGRLAAIFQTSDHRSSRSLAEVSDLELIAELARRLSLPRMDEVADSSEDVDPPSRNGTIHRVGFPAESPGDAGFPSDASGDGIVGTPKND